MNNSRLYYNNYPLYPLNIHPLYLLGFFEGDGSFVSKGQVRLMVSQHSSNALLLQEKLNFLIRLSDSYTQVSYPKNETLFFYQKISRF